MAFYVCSKYLNVFIFFFSREFRNDFLELLRRRFGKHLKYFLNNNFIIVVFFSVSLFFFFLGTKRVHNNIVYNEYISHREHIHMNATQWETLTDFTKWLGREGTKRTVELVFHGFISVREVIVSFCLVFWKIRSLGQFGKQEGNLLSHSYFVICHFCLFSFLKLGLT